MEFRITIPGKPIAKKRPRFARRGKFVVTYNDQETEEGRVLWEVKNQWKGREPIESPVGCYFKFFMPYPKGFSEKKKSLLPRHVKKPDLDNLIKFYKDVFTGTVWKDDSQVWSLTASKVYHDIPQTEIYLEW
jgi:Holliday junction resolvase RusA-like endonuclease